jgi:mannitol operon repressor
LPPLNSSTVRRQSDRATERQSDRATERQSNQQCPQNYPKTQDARFAFLHAPGVFERYNAFLDEFQQETDRAAAVLAAANLDNALLHVLSASIVGGKQATARLLGRDRPLGSFGSRILACYCFGLISRDEFEELERVRKIRNDFAHEQHGFSFDAPPTSTHASSMIFHKLFASGLQLDAKTPRKIFNSSVVLLALTLLLREGGISRIAEAAPLWGAHKA